MLVNNFPAHYRQKYGQSVGKIALDLGIVCPNRTNDGGCIFCSPQSFRPYYLRPGSPILEQIQQGKAFLKTKKYSRYFAYFQQETSTAVPLETLLQTMKNLGMDPLCVGFIISTRPDAVEDLLLEALSSCETINGAPKEIIFELGLQSSRDESLRYLNRNHSVHDFLETSERISRYSYLQLGAHLILGIPGESYDDMFSTLKMACLSGAKHLKIHHLQIIAGTRLDEIYKKRPFTMFSLEEYLDLVSCLLQYIPRDVIVHRLWSSSEKAILTAPFWGVSNLEMWDRLRAICGEKDRWQGKYSL